MHVGFMNVSCNSFDFSNREDRSWYSTNYKTHIYIYRVPEKLDPKN